MDDALAKAFQTTEYRVFIEAGTVACIRVGQELPEALLRLLPQADATWGFITAWNPQSITQPPEVNAQAQDALLNGLRKQAPGATVMRGEGVGTKGWREDSLWVIDAPPGLLDGMMRQFHQYAIVQGIGSGPATLHWNCDLIRRTSQTRCDQLDPPAP